MRHFEVKDEREILSCWTTVKSQQTRSSFTKRFFFQLFSVFLCCFFSWTYYVLIYSQKKFRHLIKVGKNQNFLPKEKTFRFLNGSGSHQTVQPSVKQKMTFSEESRQKKKTKLLLYCTFKLFWLRKKVSKENEKNFGSLVWEIKVHLQKKNK